MYQTTYVRAGSLTEAENLLRDNPEAKLISGGQTLVPTLRQRLARPSHVVDIAHLAELRGISQDGDRVVIGATTTHAEVAASDLVRQKIPSLAYLVGLIGDPPVRHLGTIGGSIANNDPAADYPAAVLALNATVQTSQRMIAADDFFTGLFETALDAGEIVLRVSFPVPRRSAYEKFHQSASRSSACSSRPSPTDRFAWLSRARALVCSGRLRLRRRWLAVSPPRPPSRSPSAPTA